MAKRTVKPVEEYDREHFPHKVLERLDKTLCSYLDLTQAHQHHLRAEKENHRLGHLEVARPIKYSRQNIEEVIKTFYREEGYRVTSTVPGLLEVKKPNEDYLVSVSEGDTSFMIFVSECCNKLNLK